jgi:hypothetical protein
VPVQTPLLQSALVAQGRLLLLRRQKENWQLPLAHSAADEQIAPPGDLQVGAAHAFDLHWLSVLHAVQTEPVHRPLAHTASSVQAPLVGARQVLAMQMPLAQPVGALQSPPTGVLQAPSPLQTSSALQAGSGCSAGVLVQRPTEPGTLQAWQALLQSVLQQTLSTHLPLRQLPALPQVSPRHALQVPPQSMPVSAPFLTPSEQWPQVFVAVSQEGVVPAVQSVLTMHSTQAPLPLQTPDIPSQGMPAWIAGW